MFRANDAVAGAESIPCASECRQRSPSRHLAKGRWPDPETPHGWLKRKQITADWVFQVL